MRTSSSNNEHSNDTLMMNDPVDSLSSLLFSILFLYSRFLLLIWLTQWTYVYAGGPVLTLNGTSLTPRHIGTTSLRFYLSFPDDRTTVSRYVALLTKSQSMLCMNAVCLNATNRAWEREKKHINNDRSRSEQSERSPYSHHQPLLFSALPSLPLVRSSSRVDWKFITSRWPNCTLLCSTLLLTLLYYIVRSVRFTSLHLYIRSFFFFPFLLSFLFSTLHFSFPLPLPLFPFLLHTNSVVLIPLPWICVSLLPVHIPFWLEPWEGLNRDLHATWSQSNHMMIHS